MEKNQNELQDQQVDNKSTQPKQTDGTKKEINPNTPTATQPSNEQRKDSGKPGKQPGSSTPQTEEDEETDGTHGASKAGDSDAEPIETIKGGL